MYNSEVINLQQSDDLIENAREAGRIAVENNCDVVIQVDGNKAFGYICSALNYKKFIQEVLEKQINESKESLSHNNSNF